MSIKLLSAVWDYDVTGNTRAVLQVLCDYANDSGVCWPSNDAIAYKVGISNRQVRRIIADLKDQGVVELVEQGGKGPRNTNRVVVNLDALDLKDPEKWKDDTDDDKGDKVDIPRGTRWTSSEDKVDIAAPTEPSFLEPPLLEPSSAPFPQEKRTPKPLPENGEAQKIVKAYCAEAGIDQPAMYAKAVGQASQMVKAGITAADIPSLYAFSAEWKGTADLGLMLSQIDRWRAKPRITTAASGRNGSVNWNDHGQVEAYRQQAEREMLSRL